MQLWTCCALCCPETAVLRDARIKLLCLCFCLQSLFLISISYRPSSIVCQLLYRMLVPRATPEKVTPATDGAYCFL